MSKRKSVLLFLILKGEKKAVKDLGWVVAEIRSLIGSYRYEQAQQRVQQALDPNLSKNAKLQLLLLNVEISISQGDKINPELLKEIKSLLELDIDTKIKAEALHVISRVERRTGRYQEAINHVKESITLYRELLNSKAIVSVLNTLAQTQAVQGNFYAAREATAEALQLARASGDFQGYGRALMNCALLEQELGFHDLAIAHYELANQLLEETGDKKYLALALNNLADLEITRGDLSKGLHLLQQALFLWRIVGGKGKISVVLTQMGRINMLKGNLQDAELLFRAAIDLASPDQTLHPLAFIWALGNMADFERRRGHLDQALKLAKDSVSLLEKAEISGTDLAYSWGMVTSILLEMNKISQSEYALETCEVICNSLDYSEGIVHNILLRGILELQKGNLGLAQEYLAKARAASEENKFFEIQIQAELALADMYLQKLKIKYDEAQQENAAASLLTASQLAEQTALQSVKLEAKILKAVAQSINGQYEDAVRILQAVETKARALELHLIGDKARKNRLPILTLMRILKIPPPPNIQIDIMKEYIDQALECIADAQITLRKP
ncbi:MAG: tetratricopeptide repeat protein [Candidatus Hodarchaeota archaeon]